MGCLRRSTTCLVATLVLSGCAQRRADVPPAAAVADPGPTASAPSAAGTAGVRIFIDPVTGETRAPAPAELASMEEAGRSEAGTAAVTVAPDVVVTPLPGGITEYSIAGGAQADETTCLREDGKLGECSAAQKAALRAAPKPEGK